MQLKYCLKSSANFNAKKFEQDELKNSERRTRKMLNEFNNMK